MLNNNNTDEYITFTGSIVKAFLLNANENPHFFNLVTIYQLQSHLKSCRK